MVSLLIIHRAEEQADFYKFNIDKSTSGGIYSLYPLMILQYNPFAPD